MRWAFIGALALLVCIVYMAPATLLAAALGDAGPARLSHVQGSIWEGQAEAAYQDQPLGSLSWEFDAGGLAAGEAAFDWRLAAAGHALAGSARLGFDGLDCEAKGTVRGAALRRILAPYWIEAGGDLQIERIDAQLDFDGKPRDVSGALSWNGGEVRYRLADEHYRIVLPPLAGRLETPAAKPELTVFAEGIDAPLLRLRLDADGWLDIGVTKMLTKLAGFPWPGNEPDHAIVIDVSERLI